MSHKYTKEEVIQFCRNHLAVAEFYDQKVEQFKSEKAELIPLLEKFGSWGWLYAEPFKTFFSKLSGLMAVDIRDLLPEPEAFAQCDFDATTLGGHSLEGESDTLQHAMLVFAMLALQGHIRALDIYNQTMDVLLDKAATDDQALFKAIRVDPAVLAATPVQSRIAKAVLFSEDEFFKKLAKAMTGIKPRRPAEKYDSIRSLVGILDEVHALDAMTQNEVCEIFIDHLGLYPHDTDDPYAGLNKLIKNIRTQAGK